MLFLTDVDHVSFEKANETRQNNLQSATVSLQVVIGLCKRKETAALKIKAAVSNGRVKLSALRRLFSFAVVRQIFSFKEIFMKFYDTARSNKSTHFLLLIKYSLFSIPFWNTSKKQGISPIIHKSVPTGKTTVIST